MTYRLVILAVATGLAAVVSTPAVVQSQTGTPAPTPRATAAPPATAMPQANMTEMMARMKAADPKLDALVKKMNGATGAAKTDAMAELLTAVVEDRRNGCEPMMANMMSMMNMMGNRGTQTGTTPPTPSK